jgi:hypothetical protein
MLKLAIVSAIISLWSMSSLAQSADQGQAICYEVQNTVNALVNYTETKCIPVAKETEAISFIVISSEPVFSRETSKKAWVLVVVASIGKSLNQRPRVKTNELWLSDINQMKSRVSYAIPVSVAKTLQRQIVNDKLDLDEMYSIIKKRLIRKVIPR